MFINVYKCLLTIIVARVQKLIKPVINHSSNMCEKSLFTKLNTPTYQPTSYQTSKRLYYQTSKSLYHLNQTYINIYKRL